MKIRVLASSVLDSSFNLHNTHSGFRKEFEYSKSLETKNQNTLKIKNVPISQTSTQSVNPNIRFAAANLAVNDSAWKYGPEYTFEVHANFTMLKKGSNVPTYNVNSVTHLLCRPRSIDTLNCRFRNWRGAGDKHAVDMHLNPDPFDVKFNNKGITELVTSKNPREPNTFGPLKFIVNLLSIGTDLTNRPDGNFDDSENFVLGDCVATFNVQHLSDDEDSLERSDEERSKKSLRLSSLPSLNKVPGENIHVDKQRDLKRCTLNQNSLCFEDMVLGRYVYKDTNCTTKVELVISYRVF